MPSMAHSGWDLVCMTQRGSQWITKHQAILSSTKTSQCFCIPGLTLVPKEDGRWVQPLQRVSESWTPAQDNQPCPGLFQETNRWSSSGKEVHPRQPVCVMESMVFLWICIRSRVVLSIVRPYQFGEVHVSQHSHYSCALAVLWVGSFGSAQCSQHW